ncbi:MAG: hypothetical protein ACLFQR_04210 [Desulfovibrionales bacterium]
MNRLNSSVKRLLQNGGDDFSPIRLPDEFTMQEIPLEGLAAYWLSISRALSGKKGSRFLQGELQHVREPYLRHLLEIGFSSFTSEQIRRFASIKKATILSDLKRKLFLMLIALMGIYNKENPQQILIRIISRFPISPVLEKEVFQKAQELLELVELGNGPAKELISVDHSMEAHDFIVNLIFYTMLSRRQGWEACGPFISDIRSPLFAEGLSLIIDRFDYDFIKHRLNLQKNEILQDSEIKMDMAMEMCIGIREDMAYEDLLRIAHSFML